MWPENINKISQILSNRSLFKAQRQAMYSAKRLQKSWKKNSWWMRCGGHHISRQVLVININSNCRVHNTSSQDSIITFKVLRIWVLRITSTTAEQNTVCIRKLKEKKEENKVSYLSLPIQKEHTGVKLVDFIASCPAHFSRVFPAYFFHPLQWTFVVPPEAKAN